MSKPLHMFMLMFILLVLCALPFTLATKISSSNQSLSHDEECSILFQFKENMSINNSAYDARVYPTASSWKVNRSESRNDCCLWDGVKCDGESSSRHVIGLDLSSSLLYGSINSNNNLFRLLHLRRLNLADNDFRSSQIPSGIGSLSHLMYLNLSYSNFNGIVPKEISQLNQLVSVDLSGNNFRGCIPSLASLSRLCYLDLSYNGFDGRNLSDWLGKLPNLSYLDLSSNNLSCEIPSTIGNQTQLTELYLNDNHMVGQIPFSLVNLTHLTTLSLSNNQLTGRVPSLESLAKLTDLFISTNYLDQWKLPDWLGKLNKLQRLQLRNVSLYGEIPSLIFNLTQVSFLDFSRNQIEGLIPTFPSTMTKLMALDLAGNRLNGTIPSSLLNLKNLELLFLDNNNISGTIEIGFFHSLKKLKNLYLGGNRITLSVINKNTTHTLPKFESLKLHSCNLRVFPDFLRFQNQLQQLDLDDNKIEGLIPEWMGNMSNETLQVLSLFGNLLTGFEKRWPVVPWAGLEFLDISYNRLHQFIPVPPPSIQQFFISNNKLIGEIPPSICDLQSLMVLDLSFNNITGSLPPCLDKLSNSLLVLTLRHNSLQGTIHNTFTNGSNIQIIDLSENQLQGPLPRSLENCVSLQILNLGNNHIDDMFPFWLGALPDLQVLILRSNKFHGALRVHSKTNFKFTKLRIIDLSNNSFSGDLPHQYFQKWSAMKERDSDGTYMQGNINIMDESHRWLVNYPYSITLITKGVNLEYEKIINIFVAVDLSSNRFGGKIPESIKSLGNLQLLNLFNNELSGVIPSLMGNMTQLESLDLSSNKLSGKIPQELVQLNFLEYLNVSYNNLAGPIPQGGQFITFQNISYMGNPSLCGYPLSKKCGNSNATKPPIVSFDDDQTKSDSPNGAVDWVFILSGVGSGLVIGLLFGNHLMTRYYHWFLRRYRK